MTHFSVIIPTHNRIEFLQETLQSIWQQTYTNFEVIVVDDGSSDGTTEFLKSMDGRLRSFLQSNRGPGAARNAGASHARGDYLAFLDSDDLWFPWTLQTYNSAIEQTASPGFIAGKPCRFNVPADLAGTREQPLSLLRFDDYLASGDQWRWWGTSSFVVRGELFRQAGGFTDNRVNGEDADLALRLGIEPGFVQITAPDTFAYREHGVSATKDLQRTLDGAWLKVRTEKSQGYPGGRLRFAERRRILTRHTRPVTLSCLKAGRLRDGWGLYRATLAWNAAERRVPYLLGFPILAAVWQIRRWAGERS